ncbi:MAG: hypothetical protein FJY82_14145, partial [Candidatus Aminicenantes bacterium]|nr:hypothetical protein [Candidatus Aminicenantes bacterium]
MSRPPFFRGLGTIVVLGSVWGLAEAALGLVLRGCAHLVSGSIMTGTALLFIAAGWRRTRRAAGPLLLVAVASAFKLIDAALLGLPVIHGAVAHPIFAFVTQGLAFLLILPFLAERRVGRFSGQAFLGGASALLAVNVYPLVKFVTGIPACVVPGGTIPLALYYAPVAVGLSLLTVPTGFRLGGWAEAWERALAGRPAFGRRASLIPAASALLCLA